MDDTLTVGLVSVVYRLEWETAYLCLAAYLAYSGLSSFAVRERILAGAEDTERWMGHSSVSPSVSSSGGR